MKKTLKVSLRKPNQNWCNSISNIYSIQVPDWDETIYPIDIINIRSLRNQYYLARAFESILLASRAKRQRHNVQNALNWLKRINHINQHFHYLDDD